MKEKTPAKSGGVQFSIRLPDDLYRRLNFIAADLDVSRNQLISRYLLEAVEGVRVSLPKSLSPSQEPQLREC